MLDPTMARTLATAMRQGDAETDPRTMFIVNSDLLGYSESEIRDLPGISWKDKIALTEKRRQAEVSWHTG
jgi:hypothetical protein